MLVNTYVSTATGPEPALRPDQENTNMNWKSALSLFSAIVPLFYHWSPATRGEHSSPSEHNNVEEQHGEVVGVTMATAALGSLFRGFHRLQGIAAIHPAEFSDLPEAMAQLAAERVKTDEKQAHSITTATATTMTGIAKLMELSKGLADAFASGGGHSSSLLNKLWGKKHEQNSQSDPNSCPNSSRKPLVAAVVDGTQVVFFLKWLVHEKV
jgi:hypothetical protein